MKRPAVFFDRDNTLIVSDGYLGDPAGVTLVEGAADAVARVRGLGFAAVVFSNQSGVARGMFGEDAVHAVNARMDELLHDHNSGAVIDRHEFCPFHPEGTVDAYRQESDLRKPRPGMIQQAAQKLALDLGRSWVVGDTPRDIEAGHAAGCRTILVNDPALPPSPAAGAASDVQPDHRVASLKEATDVITRAASSAAGDGEDDPRLGDDSTGVAAPSPSLEAFAPDPAPVRPAPEEPLREAPAPEKPEPAPDGSSARMVIAEESVAPVWPAEHRAAPSPASLAAREYRVSEYAALQPPAESATPALVVVKEPPAATEASRPAAPAPSGELASPAPAAARDDGADNARRPAEAAASSPRLEAVAEQILQELRRHNEQAHVEFSVSKLLAGIVQVIALAALFYPYLRTDAPSIQATLLVALFLQALTITLLIMGRQR